jgi:acyl carrier protein
MSDDGRRVELEEIRKAVKAYILAEHLPGEDPSALTDSHPLITGGIVDSVGSIKLVVFLEERYGIEVQADEVAVDHLNTIGDIADFVYAKL